MPTLVLRIFGCAGEVETSLTKPSESDSGPVEAGIFSDDDNRADKSNGIRTHWKYEMRRKRRSSTSGACSYKIIKTPPLSRANVGLAQHGTARIPPHQGPVRKFITAISIFDGAR